MLFHWGLAIAQRALLRPGSCGGSSASSLIPCSRHLARAQLAHAPPASMMSRFGSYSAAAPCSLVPEGRSGAERLFSPMLGRWF